MSQPLERSLAQPSGPDAVDVAGDTLMAGFRQRSTHALDSVIPGVAIRQNFGHQRVLVWGNVVAAVQMAIHLNSRTALGHPFFERAGAGHGTERVFSIDSAFDCVPTQMHVLQAEAEWLTKRDE